MGYSTFIVICLYAYVCSVYSNPQPKNPIGNCSNSTTISYCSDCSTVAICPAVTTATTGTKSSSTSTLTTSSTTGTMSSSTSTLTTSSTTSPMSSPTSTLTTSTTIGPMSSSTSTSTTSSTIQTCTSGNLCMQTSIYALCEPASEVPSCECPPTGLTSIPDAYDNQKYIICVDGTGTVEKCDSGYYHPDTQTCEPTVVTVPPTTTKHPLTCTGVEVIPVNCTAYEICVPNGEPVVGLCGPGEIATDNPNEPCRFYEPFSCADYAGPAYFADTTNCSIGHFCIDGEERGEPLICEQDQSFDNSTKQCVTDPSGDHCSAVEDCGICQDSTTKITIDCYSYYQCSDGTGETGDLPFVPVLKNCTGSYNYYNPDAQACSTYPPAGC